jgi:pyruvate,water dikinase
MTTVPTTAPSGAEPDRSDAPQTWVAPGPGYWERDTAHQERPFSRLFFETVGPTLERGTAEAFASMGLPLAQLHVADLDGWFYATMLAVPDDELVTRVDVAERALATRAWRAVADEWHATERSDFVARNRALQAVDPSALDDAALAAHVHDALDLLADAGTRHFLQAVAHWVGVGLLVDEAGAIAGWTPADTIAALAGSSPSSAAPAAALHDIAVAIAAVPAAGALLDAGGDAGTTLEALRASSPQVRRTIDAYMDEYGWQVFTGFDLTHQAMVELPSLFLSTLRSVAPVPQRSSDRLAALIAAAPADDRARVATVVDDAVVLYGLRDDDSGLTIHRPLGLARRALLEGGRRATAAGRLHDADHILDARRGDLDALITGSGRAPSADELRTVGARRRSPYVVPPVGLGEPEPPPDGDLPPAMGTILGALLVAMSLEVFDPGDPIGADGALRGCAASPGVHEGRARIVRGEGDFERIEAGDVLVAAMTTPAYNVVLPLLGAVVTDTGGLLCHAAIVAREFEIPAVVGVPTATSAIADGDLVRVDGDAGTISVLRTASAGS